jgi:hypothetical protein
MIRIKIMQEFIGFHNIKFTIFWIMKLISKYIVIISINFFYSFKDSRI